MDIKERDMDKARECKAVCVFKKHDIVRILETAAKGFFGMVVFFYGINGDGTAHVIHSYKSGYDVPADIRQPLSREQKKGA